MMVLVWEGIGMVVMGVLCVAASYVGHPRKEEREF